MSQSTPDQQTDTLLKLQDVSRVYQMGQVKVRAVTDLTLEIKRGELIVILGPSGSGKTTLLNLIGGIDSPTSGRIFYDGKDITALDEKGLTHYRRENIGFIFQFFNLIPSLTAKENVEFAAELVKAPRNPLEMLAIVGLEDRADHYPSELSGGEQQRVAIARALVKDPPILIGDEPTGDLDYDTGKNILDAMRRINRERLKTVLLVTHNAAIGEMADRVIRMRSGRIIEIIRNPSPIDPQELKW
ncbi:MAG: ABC transporter ATP-binding protein [Dehalococcoidia bacterium]|nr:ABC transporter ATP-binding protein [Dehalococcoidia bacterium]